VTLVLHCLLTGQYQATRLKNVNLIFVLSSLKLPDPGLFSRRDRRAYGIGAIVSLSGPLAVSGIGVVESVTWKTKLVFVYHRGGCPADCDLPGKPRCSRPEKPPRSSHPIAADPYTGERLLAPSRSYNVLARRNGSGLCRDASAPG